MDRAFRMAGRAGSEQPDRNVVASRIGRRAFFRQQLFTVSSNVAHLTVVLSGSSAVVADDQHSSQIARARRRFRKSLQQRMMNNRDFRSCVVEVVFIIRSGSSGLTIVITAPMRAAPNQVQTNSGQSGRTSKTRSSMFAPNSRSALPVWFESRATSP